MLVGPSPGNICRKESYLYDHKAGYQAGKKTDLALVGQTVRVALAKEKIIQTGK